MARFNSILNSFSSGEVSPRLYGRTDLDNYKKSLKTLKNMYVTPQGGVRRRAGTQLVLNDLARKANFPLVDLKYIIPFVISSEEKYLILVYIFGSSFVFYAYNPDDDFLSQLPTEQDITLGFPGIFMPPELNELSTSQAGDLMFVAHKTSPPFYFARVKRNKIRYQNISTRPSDLNESTSKTKNLSMLLSFPFKDINTKNIVMTSNATSGTSVTITSSVSFFSLKHLSLPMAFMDSSVIGIGHIVAVASSTSITLDVRQTLPAIMLTTGLTTWKECAWKKGDFPRTVVAHKNSLYLMGSDSQADTIWKSQDFDLFEFSNDRIIDPGLTPVASDPASISISAESAKIQWAKSHGSDILIGTASNEYSIKNMTGNSVPDLRKHSSYGSEYIGGIDVGNKVLFIQRGYKAIRDLVFDFNTDGYISRNISLVADHMLEKALENLLIVPSTNRFPRIIQLAYRKYPNSVLYALDNYGFLRSVSLDSQAGITAWNTIEFGGTSANFSDSGKVLSIASIPSNENREDDLYVVIERVINGATKTYLEKIGANFTEKQLDLNIDDGVSIPVFSDSSIIYRARSTPKLWATLSNDEDAEVSSGVGTGTISAGGVNFSANYAQLATTKTSYIDYAALDNFDFPSIGTIGFSLFGLKDSSGSHIIDYYFSLFGTGNNNLLFLRKSTDVVGGTTLELGVYTSSGVESFLNTVVELESFIGETVGEPDVDEKRSDIMNIELSYNFSGGTTYLFINGKEVTGGLTISSSRTNVLNTLRIGADSSGGSGPILGTGFYNIYTYDTQLHTEDFVFYPMQAKDTTIRNLHHLQGETVEVVGDGNFLGSFVVTAQGTIFLTATYDTVVIGLPYTHELETLPIEAGGNLGNSQGEIKRIDEIVVRFQDTASCKYGPSNTNTLEINFRDVDSLLDSPIALFTGDKVLEFDGEYDTNASIVLTDNKPLPCNITAIIYKGITYG